MWEILKIATKLQIQENQKYSVLSLFANIIGSFNSTLPPSS